MIDQSWHWATGMEDFTATDVALNAGYYQGHFEALPLVVLAIRLLGLMQWVLQTRLEKR